MIPRMHRLQTGAFDPFMYEFHEDLKTEVVSIRQGRMARHLKLAGLDRHVLSDGLISYPARKFCQIRAAKRRLLWEQQDLGDLRRECQEPDTVPVAVTIVFPESISFDLREYLPRAAIKYLRRTVYRALRRDPSITLVVGAIEVDYCLKGGKQFWQRTAHLSMAVVAADFASASKKVREALGLTATSLVPKPVVCRQMPGPMRWVRYCLKGLAYGSVVRKCSYPTDPAKRIKAGSRKLTLHAPERNAMLRAMVHIQWSDLRIRARQPS